MLVGSEQRPALALPSRELIKDIWRIHHRCGTLLPLARALRVLGDIAPADAQQLARRGDLELTSLDTNNGTFQNAGDTSISVSTADARLIIPARLAGEYQVDKSHCELTFRYDSAIEVHKYVFKTIVKRVVATQASIALYLGRAEQQITYTF